MAAYLSCALKKLNADFAAFLARHALANLDDLLTSRVGGLVREYMPNAVRNEETPFVAGASFSILARGWEGRFGVARTPDALRTKASELGLCRSWRERERDATNDHKNG